MKRAAESSSEQSTALCIFLHKGLLPYDHRHPLSIIAGNYQQGSRQDGRTCRYPGYIHGGYNSQSQPSLHDPCHDDQAVEDAEGRSQETLLDRHAPAAAPYFGQPIVAENQTYVSEDE